MSFHFKNSTVHRLKNLFLDEDALRNFIQETTANSDIPEIIIRKLTHLKILKGIPFHYLVPHPEMLPEESIKFFYLDPSWINAMIDGAFSIGRYATKKKEKQTQYTTPHISEIHDEVHADLLHQQCYKSAQKHRSYMLKERTSFVENERSNYSSSSEISSVISGFLLRSKTVSQYKNMKVMGHKEKVEGAPKEPLKIYRFDHIDQELLFCLFEGDFKQLDIHQPSQGIHFGLNKKPKQEEGDSNFEKVLRSSNSKGTVGSVPVNFRDPETQVVNLSQLSQNMASILKPDYYDAKNQTGLLSSDFALQMVKGVGIVRFLKD